MTRTAGLLCGIILPLSFLPSFAALLEDSADTGSHGRERNALFTREGSSKTVDNVCSICPPKCVDVTGTAAQQVCFYRQYHFRQPRRLSLVRKAEPADTELCKCGGWGGGKSLVWCAA